MKKKNIIIGILATILLVCIVVGVSLAFFNYAQVGTTDNTLETGNITFLYTETSEVGRGISITDALPMTDEEGKLLTGEGNVFDFNIAATTASNINIPYEITLEKLDESGIEGNCIRVYLTKTNGLTEEEVVLETFTNLEQTTRVNDKVEKVLYKDAIDVNESYNQDYRLRMWVSNNYGDNDIGKSFMIKVNVYADGNVGSLCEYEPGQTWNFNYTGGMQSFTVSTGCSGTYKLEVWGAQGGNSGYGGNGGYGGYAYGNVKLLAGNVIYVGVGGQNSYNGGGTAGGGGVYACGCGGGATHMGKTNALLKNTSSSNVYLVAGGGGGGYTNTGEGVSANGGAGGGTSGGTGYWKGVYSVAATQSSGYAYGQGQNNMSAYSAGAGGGYYGGRCSDTGGSAGGGSGYIGGVTDGSMQDGVQLGNGKATITLVSLD